MAGVTFLAFGNGSPDVFSTFAAIKSHSGSLAVGELFGAAGFITAVVAGSMALVQDFHVPKKSFLRDVGFFVVAVSFSMSFLSNGELDMWECAVMVGFYVFYVLIVILWHWRLGRRRRRREQEAMARGHFVDSGGQEIEFEDEYHDDDDDRSASSRIYPRPISSDDFNDLERAGQQFPFPEDFDDEEQRDRVMGELSSNMRVSRRPRRERRSTLNPIRPSLVGALEFQAASSALRRSGTFQSAPINMRRHSDDPSVMLPQHRSRSSSATPLRAASSSAANGDGAADVLSQSSNAAYRNTGPRTRAASANAADILQLSDRRGHDASGTRRPLNSYGTQDVGRLPPTMEQDSVREARETSPLLSISPPPEAHDEHEQLPSQGLARSTTHDDLLAPPDMASGGKQGPNDRPGLKVTPPASRTVSGDSSPVEAPYYTHSPATMSTTSLQGFPELRIQPPDSLSSKPLPPAAWQSEQKAARWWPSTVLPHPYEILSTLFPGLCGWRAKSYWERIINVATVPSFFLLTITLPVVESGSTEDQESLPIPSIPASAATNMPDNVRNGSAGTKNHPHPGSSYESTATVAVQTEQRQSHNISSFDHSPLAPPLPNHFDHPQASVTAGKDWNRWLVLIQCFTAPYLLVLAVWANLDEPDARSLIRPSLLSLLGSLILAAVILALTKPDRPPRGHFLLCFLGFAVSITWISSIANEVVGVLKTIGVIFNMSDAILGLTIFAVGNSLGDLVADIQVARLGYPYMAFSACFGGPMLNILLGIGLSGLYMTLTKANKWHRKHPDQNPRFKPYEVEISVTLLISAVALLITLVGLLVVIPLNGWKMDKRIGTGLMVLWCVATTANVIVELVGIG